MIKVSKIRKVRVKDLKDQIGMTGHRPILLCRICMTENSANRGDYFEADPDHVFDCCGKPMMLCIKKTVYDEIDF